MRLAFQSGLMYGPPVLPLPRLQGHNRYGIGGIGIGIGDDSGDGPSALQVAGGAIQGAESGAATALMLGGSTKADIVGGVQAGVETAALFAGPAAPIVAAIGALIGPIASLFKGCGQTCTQATQYADAAETALGKILTLYQAQPVHYRSTQTAALAAFDQTAAQLRAACSNPQLGAAGQRCISERLIQGGPAPWCPNPGNVGCDWITTYRVPIANDPNVVADPVISTDAQGNTTLNVAGTALPMPLVLAGAALLLLLVLGGGK